MSQRLKDISPLGDHPLAQTAADCLEEDTRSLPLHELLDMQQMSFRNARPALQLMTGDQKSFLALFFLYSLELHRRVEELVKKGALK